MYSDIETAKEAVYSHYQVMTKALANAPEEVPTDALERLNADRDDTLYALRYVLGIPVVEIAQHLNLAWWEVYATLDRVKDRRNQRQSFSSWGEMVLPPAPASDQPTRTTIDDFLKPPDGGEGGEA